VRILVQCTIREAPDDWHVGRFALLARELGRTAEVVSRNLEPDARGDPVLSRLSRRDFDEAWLLGVDTGHGLSAHDIAGVNAFHAAGGGLLTARDHQDMGRWLRELEGVGQAHFFHSAECCEPDPDRRRPDDVETASISWPNYHSGRNGDPQRIEVLEREHPLVARPGGGHLELFPAHPHEGAVGAPPGEPRARVIASGTSQTTGRRFALVVALDRGAEHPGRAIAESSFHHFADYNWDPSHGAPSFVTEPVGDGMRTDARALEDIRAYVTNAARWLAPAEGREDG
jgi:hypothetical protein